MELNVDSTVVVEVILKGASTTYEGHVLIRQITRLIEMHGDVKVSHIFREANKCVDALANEGCKLHDSYTFILLQ